MLPKIISAPKSLTSSTVIALTVPQVPTGIKAGVFTTPRSKDSFPRRALLSVLVTSNFIERLIN